MHLHHGPADYTLVSELSGVYESSRPCSKRKCGCHHESCCLLEAFAESDNWLKFYNVNRERTAVKGFLLLIALTEEEPLTIVMFSVPPGKYRPLGMDTLHRPPKMLKKVELITGDPHDGKNLGRVLTEKESRVFVGTGTRTLKAKSNNGALLAIQALINSALPVDDGFLGLLTKRGMCVAFLKCILRENNNLLPKKSF